jgi:hypothetical protein
MQRCPDPPIQVHCARVIMLFVFAGGLGGALRLAYTAYDAYSRGYATVSGTSFTDNIAREDGAIYASYDIVLMQVRNTFSGNTGALLKHSVAESMNNLSCQASARSSEHPAP